MCKYTIEQIEAAFDRADDTYIHADTLIAELTRPAFVPKVNQYYILETTGECLLHADPCLKLSDEHVRRSLNQEEVGSDWMPRVEKFGYVTGWHQTIYTIGYNAAIDMVNKKLGLNGE